MAKSTSHLHFHAIATDMDKTMLIDLAQIKATKHTKSD